MRVALVGGLAAILTLTLAGSALTFIAVDRNLHSVSDTLRTFLILVAPLRVVVLLSSWALFRFVRARRGS